MTSLRFSSLLLLAGLLTLAACDSGEMTDDVTPPSASSASSNGSTVTISFNEAIDPSSVSASTFTLTPGPVGVAGASASGTSATLTLSGPLDDSERVTYTVTGSGIRDLAGNTTSVTVTFSYGNGGGGGGGSEIGAAYPNAGDSRIVLINADGDRFLLFNPTTGVVTDADDIDDIENGLIPLSSIGASANVFGEEETYFFDLDGDTFTNYERDVADFDAPASFEEEYDEFGYDLDSVGAASEGDRFANDSIILFNQNGTQWQLWQPESDSFSDVMTFPAQFGGGNSPISSVGAAFYREESSQLYLFNRAGTQYTIWTGGSNFSAAFPVSELGDIEF